MQNEECKVQNEGLKAEEIVKSLRVCHNTAPAMKDCDECPYGEHRCLDLETDAADLIEAQAKRIGELEAELAKLREENRFIPVEERKPDKELDEIAAVVNAEWHYPGFRCLAIIRGDKYPTILNYADIDGDRTWVDDECNGYSVTHWKSLPKGVAG